MKLSSLAAQTSQPLSVAEWERRKAELLEQWQRILGPSPVRPELEPAILSTTTETDHVRQLVTYQVEPGVRVHAHVLLPLELRSRAPGAVAFHGTNSDHIFQSVGMAGPPTRQLALHLVRRGYVTLSPRCFIFGYNEDSLTTAPRNTRHYGEATTRVLGRNPAWTGMGKMLWDGMRAVDYLVSRPEVDPDRIVCAGHSLGAKETLYLTAFDSRVRAGVASEGGVGLSLSNWDAPWYLGDKIKPPQFTHDHHELIACIAPRGLMVVGGASADGEHSRPWIDAARPIFDLYGRPDNLSLLLHQAGHDFPPDVREQAFRWLDNSAQIRQ